MDSTAVLLIGQYRAALEMLKKAVKMCPAELWTEKPPKYPFWRIAYHATFFTHLYAATSLETIEKWKYHDDHLEDMDTPAHGHVYSTDDIIEYAGFTVNQLTREIPDQPMSGPSHVPWWGDFTKLELHVYNIRHTQHHVGQLADRLRNDADLDVPWIGSI